MNELCKNGLPGRFLETQISDFLRNFGTNFLRNFGNYFL